MKNITVLRIAAKHLFAGLFITISLLSFVSAHAQSYKFKLGIDYAISSDGSTHNMGMWFSDADYTGMEAKEGGNSAFVIFNMKDKKMITVMEAQKMVMIMDLNKYQQMMAGKAEEGDDSKSNSKIEKTGVTEKILGYNCDQYKITSDKSETLVWITKDLGVSYAGFAKSLMMALNTGKTKGPSVPDMQGATDGVMLKMESKDLSTNKVTKLEATAVNKNGKEINISDYKTMSM